MDKFIIPLLYKGINSLLQFFYSSFIIVTDGIDDTVIDMVLQDDPTYTGNGRMDSCQLN